MISLSLLCVLFGLAIFANWIAQKSEGSYLWLGIVAILLLFGRTMIMGQWLLLCIMLLGLLLEALWPRRWYNWASKETLESLGINSFASLVAIAVQALVFGDLMEDLPPGTGSWRFLPTEASLWLHVLVLVALLDFKRYWFHRLDHCSIFFWRFHKIHHELQELHCISGNRDYPTYNVGHVISDIVIVYLIGATKEAFALTLVIQVIFAVFIAHLNVNFPSVDEKFPWFAYLIVTPNFHAWHHTVHCRYDANLADIFPIWDVLFRTFEVPRGNPCDWQFGLQQSERLPQSVLEKLISPFINVSSTG